MAVAVLVDKSGNGTHELSFVLFVFLLVVLLCMALRYNKVEDPYDDHC